MKIELENIRLGHSSLTDKVFAGVLAPCKNEKPLLWKHKKDVTDDFISAVIARWENQTEKITAGDNQWEITVRKIK